jgi:hypothetical protein
MGEPYNSMAPQLTSAPKTQSLSMLSRYTDTILMSRAMYESCHIETPDHSFVMAAISVKEQFYSLFRVEKSEEAATETLKKLNERGDQTAVTIIPKGYAIWVLEPGAIPLGKNNSFFNPHRDKGKLAAAIEDQPHSSEAQDISYQILTSRRQYKTGKALIRGMDRPVPVVYFQKKCYSLFRTIHDIKQTAQIVKQVSARGKQVVVTRKDQGYGVWVLEDNAQMIES